MDLNVLSPAQFSNLRTFEYEPIESVTDDKLKASNKNFKRVLSTMHLQNQKVQGDVNSLQIILDTIL
jgi:hypothetical protein